MDVCVLIHILLEHGHHIRVFSSTCKSAQRAGSVQGHQNWLQRCWMECPQAPKYQGLGKEDEHTGHAGPPLG